MTAFLEFKRKTRALFLGRRKLVGSVGMANVLKDQKTTSLGVTHSPSDLMISRVL